MSTKRTYTTMSSDSSHITQPINSDINSILEQPPTKRRRLNKHHNNKKNKSKTNTKVTKSIHKKSFNNHTHDNRNTHDQNLQQNRITTKTKTNKKEQSEKYQPIKKRLFIETPSPITHTSSECSPTPSTPMSLPIETDNICDQNSNINYNQSPRQSPINLKNIKRKIHFEDKINDNKTPNINNNLPQITHHNHILRNDIANGIYDFNTLRRRKAFRNYVLCNLNDDKPRITCICFVFGIVFGFYGVLHLFYFVYYDTMDILLSLMIILSILRDLSNCNGDGGLSIIIILTFLIRRFMEFVYIKYNGNDVVDNHEKIFNYLMVLGLLTTILYLFVFNECYWNAVQERIFNRGIMRRMISYLIYFWFNGYMVMELMECLCVNAINGKNKNNNNINNRLSINSVILYGFICIVVCLWFKLQDTKYIHVEQFKLNEICGFIMIMWINYGMCFDGLEYNSKMTDGVMNTPYVLSMLTVILLLHKLFYL